MDEIRKILGAPTHTINLRGCMQHKDDLVARNFDRVFEQFWRELPEKLKAVLPNGPIAIKTPHWKSARGASGPRAL